MAFVQCSKCGRIECQCPPPGNWHIEVRITTPDGKVVAEEKFVSPRFSSVVNIAQAWIEELGPY